MDKDEEAEEIGADDPDNMQLKQKKFPENNKKKAQIQIDMLKKATQKNIEQ